MQTLATEPRLLAAPPVLRNLRAIAKAVLTILRISAIAASVSATRTLVFRYTHGDQQTVVRLIESLLPWP